ncbi:STAS domain-containing protein [Actinokineospora bangkokensis]|uniref:STAS domain-containing protein n=1 Tax=Actinokineospora bangkokensis TaxID=1193682 RepID=A0A1Q9LN84_9PSEU|nr:STAS domain-containing protein [Actinokineospora bangkokensis]OLR93471.1 hypothetical protein BJP25_14280 [Actinokineospora bangkokensis]
MFTLDTGSLGRATAVIAVAGDVRAGEAGALAKALTEARGRVEQAVVVVLDLRGVGALSTAAVREVVAFCAATDALGFTAWLVTAPSGHVRELLAIAGVHRFAREVSAEDLGVRESAAQR